MVSQEPRSITHCTKVRDEEWRIETVGEEQGAILLPTLEVELSFGQIYADLDLLP